MLAAAMVAGVAILRGSWRNRNHGFHGFNGFTERQTKTACRSLIINIKNKGIMANIAKPQVTRIPWQEGMRVTGKYEMSVKDYGEYLMRSGKNKHNTLKRKKLMRATA